jgi:Tfp pilus assembly protein PilO
MPKLEELFKRLNTLSVQQKKIVSVGGVVFFFFLFVVFFFFLTQSRKILAIKKELAQTQGEIAQIMQITEGKDLAKSVEELRLKLNQLATKLPAQDEEVISHFSSLAKKMGININSVMPGEEKVIEGGVSGYTISELPISIKLSSEYKSLGEYLRALGDSPSVLISLHQLDIVGKGEGQPRLDVTLKLSAYLASKE